MVKPRKHDGNIHLFYNISIRNDFLFGQCMQFTNIWNEFDHFLKVFLREITIDTYRYHHLRNLIRQDLGPS